MKISWQSLEANITLVRLKGRLDAMACSEVKATLRKFIEKGWLNIVIDLQSVPFIDSSGLTALVSGLRLAREKGGNIALSNIPPQAQTVFHLTMLDRIFSIYPTVDEAKQSLI